ncbi:tetratricopeptide repeat protein [Treponema sp. SP13]|uniref:tetratricopeptide repeat protein n=1 Tax=Treponema sp. SP13 TaxID=2789742 RepID=UPI003D8C9EAF
MKKKFVCFGVRDFCLRRNSAHLPNAFCFFLLIVNFYFVVCAASCRMSASRSSFTGMLDDIDALSEQGQDRDALSELKKAEKYVYDSWSRIGIYRRYFEMGETALAEKTLVRGLKRNPKNPEMSAVYAQFLMCSGRGAEAVKVAECLRGTRFGSVYSEAYLHELAFEKGANASEYFDKRFFSVFCDAYAGSNDAYWLRDAALICLKDGDYDTAYSIKPTDCFEPEDAFFWSLVMFDSRRFGEAAAYAEKARSLYPTSSIRSRHRVSPVEIAAVLSDSHIALSETEEAERARRSVIAEMERNTGGMNIADENVSSLLPSLFVDSALYAEANGNDDEASRLLTDTVNAWPDYAPALIAYADFARRTSMPPSEDLQELTLRDNGLATLKMEAYDRRAKIPVSDAEYRIDRSLERINNPVLYIARLHLKYETDFSLTPDEKISDVWNELERSSVGANVYPDVIFEFALNRLLAYRRYDDAFRLFRKSIAAKYGFDASRDFWESCASSVRDMTIREAEYAAWFAAYGRLADTAIRLYEYCVYESGGGTDGKTISSLVSTPSCMNLAMIYESLGSNVQAIDLYAASSVRAADAMQRAEIQYRMALIYSAQGKTREALRSAGYALALVPTHARAKLLRDRLTEQSR